MSLHIILQIRDVTLSHLRSLAEGGYRWGLRGVCGAFTGRVQVILTNHNTCSVSHLRGQQKRTFMESINCIWWEGRQKPSFKLLPQEWWSYLVKVLEEYLDAHWESWSCASRSSCGYVSSSWGWMIRMSLKQLSTIILKVRPPSFRYVTKLFLFKLNFSNISYHFVEFNVANYIVTYF